MAKIVLTLEDGLKQAAEYLAAGNWDLAETFYRTILAKIPGNWEADQGLNKVLELKGLGSASASPTFTHMRPATEPSAGELQALDALSKLGRFSEVEAGARHLAEAHPTSHAVHTILGVALWRQNKFDDAIASYRRSLEIQPNNSETQNNLGTALFGQRKFAEAVESFKRALAIGPDQSAVYYNLGVSLESGGEAGAAAAAYRACMTRAPDNTAVHMGLIRTLTVLGDVAAADEWALNCGLPLMQKLSEQGLFNKMAELVSVFFQFQKIQDTEEQYARFCVPAMEIFYRAVSDAASLQPALPLIMHRRGRKRRKIAFFAESISQLAHTRNLFNYVRSIAVRADLDLEPVIYFQVAESEKVITQYHDIGVTTFQIPSGLATDQSGLWLREHLRETETDVCVILGTLSGIFVFLLALRVAPIQIWWSQKYHGLKFDNIDGYLTLGGFEPHREIQGRSWRCVPGLFGPEITVPADASAMAEAGRVRASLLDSRFTKIAGVVGREEKLDNDDYWDCIAQILKKHPEMRFIWSGRSERRTIKQRIESRGLGDRCRFVGWVNTKVYVNVVDIYLDSFPFPGGHTLIEAIMAGKPVVSLVTKEARRIGIPIFAEPWLKNDGGASLRQHNFDPIFTGPGGEDLLPLVPDTRTYVARALALLDDDGFRARWIAASRQFVGRYLTDMKRPADMLNMHILEVIRDREQVFKA